MGGGSDLTLATPFPYDPLDPVDPVDPLDPLDPEMNSKNAVFIVRVAILGQNGALALCFFLNIFLRTYCTKHLLLGPNSQNLHEQGLEKSPDFAPATVQLRISLRT